MITLRVLDSSPSFMREKIEEILRHIAWYGNLTGTEAEIILRGKSDMTYLLRQGEREGHFYLTYVKDECSFTHMPFTVNAVLKQWFYLNGYPRFAPTLKGFIPEIMHAEEADCIPLLPVVSV